MIQNDLVQGRIIVSERNMEDAENTTCIHENTQVWRVPNIAALKDL